VLEHELYRAHTAVTFFNYYLQRTNITFALTFPTDGFLNLEITLGELTSQLERRKENRMGRKARLFLRNPPRKKKERKRNLDLPYKLIKLVFFLLFIFPTLFSNYEL